jgi:hypothetical protein
LSSAFYKNQRILLWPKRACAKRLNNRGVFAGIYHKTPYEQSDILVIFSRRMANKRLRFSQNKERNAKESF